MGEKWLEGILSVGELKQVLEAANDALIVLDAKGNFRYCNPLVLKVGGYTEEELLGQNFRKIIAPGHADKAIEEFRMHIDGRHTAPYEIEILRKDGRRVPVEISTGPLRVRGAVVGVVGIVRDITARKALEASLTHARDYAERLIETAPLMIVGLDKFGNITVFNRVAEEVSGYTLEELRGKNWFASVVPRNRYPEVWKVFEQMKATGRISGVFENPIVTKSGEERIIAWRNSVVREKGQAAGTISFGIDMTEKRKAEGRRPRG